jgi:adenosylmethionine-8-amino-7-oxononanoate aminotransferase
MSHAFFHPFADPAKAEDAFIDIVRADGSMLYDDSGKGYLDGLASLWYCQVGHGRHEIIDAVTEQLRTLDAYNTFDPFTNDAARAAAAAIIARCPFPDGRVFLGCSGSEAVDTVLKLVRRVAQINGQTDRQVIVRRTRGYHGTNFGGTSAQGIEPNREGWGDLVPHFVEVPADDIEAAATVFARHGERIAAVITEPVQGAGGVFPPVDGYLEGLRRLCDANGALLVFDEVISGFGRTGSWFGSQTYGVTPDLFTFAKGVTSGYQPVSGVAMTRAVAEVLESAGMLRHGYTYSGHPAGAAAAVANIDLIESDGLVERAKHLGTLFEAGLSAMTADGAIESYRGVGGVWAAELGRDAVPVRGSLLDKGVIVRPIGTALAICPPLVITDDEVAMMLDAIAEAVAE